MSLVMGSGGSYLGYIKVRWEDLPTMCGVIPWLESWTCQSCVVLSLAVIVDCVRRERELSISMHPFLSAF